MAAIYLNSLLDKKTGKIIHSFIEDGKKRIEEDEISIDFHICTYRPDAVQNAVSRGLLFHGERIPIEATEVWRSKENGNAIMKVTRKDAKGVEELRELASALYDNAPHLGIKSLDGSWMIANPFLTIPSGLDAVNIRVSDKGLRPFDGMKPEDALAVGFDIESPLQEAYELFGESPIAVMSFVSEDGNTKTFTHIPPSYSRMFKNKEDFINYVYSILEVSDLPLGFNPREVVRFPKFEDFMSTSTESERQWKRKGDNITKKGKNPDEWLMLEASRQYFYDLHDSKVVILAGHYAFGFDFPHWRERCKVFNINYLSTPFGVNATVSSSPGSARYEKHPGIFLADTELTCNKFVDIASTKLKIIHRYLTGETVPPFGAQVEPVYNSYPKRYPQLLSYNIWDSVAELKLIDELRSGGWLEFFSYFRFEPLLLQRLPIRSIWRAEIVSEIKNDDKWVPFWYLRRMGREEQGEEREATKRRRNLIKLRHVFNEGFVPNVSKIELCWDIGSMLKSVSPSDIMDVERARLKSIHHASAVSKRFSKYKSDLPGLEHGFGPQMLMGLLESWIDSENGLADHPTAEGIFSLYKSSIKELLALAKRCGIKPVAVSNLAIFIREDDLKKIPQLKTALKDLYISLGETLLADESFYGIDKHSFLFSRKATEEYSFYGKMPTSTRFAEIENEYRYEILRALAYGRPINEIVSQYSERLKSRKPFGSFIFADCIPKHPKHMDAKSLNDLRINPYAAAIARYECLTRRRYEGQKIVFIVSEEDAAVTEEYAQRNPWAKNLVSLARRVRLRSEWGGSALNISFYLERMKRFQETLYLKKEEPEVKTKPRNSLKIYM